MPVSQQVPSTVDDMPTTRIQMIVRQLIGLGMTGIRQPRSQPHVDPHPA